MWLAWHYLHYLGIFLWISTHNLDPLDLKRERERERESYYIREVGGCLVPVHNTVEILYMKEQTKQQIKIAINVDYNNNWKSTSTHHTVNQQQVNWKNSRKVGNWHDYKMYCLFIHTTPFCTIYTTTQESTCSSLFLGFGTLWVVLKPPTPFLNIKTKSCPNVTSICYYSSI